MRATLLHCSGGLALVASRGGRAVIGPGFADLSSGGAAMAFGGPGLPLGGIGSALDDDTVAFTDAVVPAKGEIFFKQFRE